MREIGYSVETCSIRRPEARHLTGAEEREAESSTFYVIDAARRQLLAAILSALARPRSLGAALALAWRTAPPGFVGGLKQLAYLAEAMILTRHLRSQGIEHLHNHFAGPSANVAMLASTLSGIPFSYSLHGPSDLIEPFNWHLREKTQRAAFVACISQFARSQAMLHSDPACWPKLRIVHCGVSPERYRGAGPNDTAGNRLVFVGRLAPAKGLRVLFEALAQVHKTRPDLTLTVIGDGDDRDALESLAAPFGDAMAFTGNLSQDGVAKALVASDIMVLPSFAEGLPVVLMESLASARPVVATRVAGVSELVEDGVSGFIVSPGDPEMLCERILRLADDAELRRYMGEAGRARVVAEFDANKEAARIGALFADLGGDDPRPDPLHPMDQDADM